MNAFFTLFSEAIEKKPMTLSPPIYFILTMNGILFLF